MTISRYCINQPTFSFIPVSQTPGIGITYERISKKLKLLVKNFSCGIINISLKNDLGEILLLDRHLISQPTQVIVIFIQLSNGQFLLNTWQPYKKAQQIFMVA